MPQLDLFAADQMPFNLDRIEEPTPRSFRRDPEAELHEIWTAQGVPEEKQAALIADLTAKAQPGAQVGPWTIPGATTEDIKADLRFESQQAHQDHPKENTTMRTMSARFRSTCPTCGETIAKGSPIQYDPETRKAYHDRKECVPLTTAWEPDAFDMMYEDQCAAACGL